jgi:hypothetical protein
MSSSMIYLVLFFNRVQQYPYRGGVAVVKVPGLCIFIYLKAIKILNGSILIDILINKRNVYIYSPYSM